MDKEVSPKILLAGLALAALGLGMDAQEPQVLGKSKLGRVAAVKSMEYDLAKSKVVRQGVPQKRFPGTFCYVDTDTVGFYTSTTLGTTFIDWGVLGGTQTTKCAGLSDIVSNFNFAYATSTQDTSVAGPGASLTISFYTNFKGFCADSGNAPVATFGFTGMPGFSGGSTGIGVTYTVSVDLSGGFEFKMPDGRFGWGYAGDGDTGPLLVSTGNGAGGPEPCTGNLDAFDIWAPDTFGVCLGTFFFSAPPNDFSSFYGQIARADLSASPAMVSTRNGSPNKAGSLACSPAVLGGALSFTVLTPGKAFAVLFAFDTAVNLVLGGGQVLLCLDVGGHGELLSSRGGLLAIPTGGIVGGCKELAAVAPVPPNLSLCGFSFTAQAVMFGPPPFALSNACDLVVGG